MKRRYVRYSLFEFGKVPIVGAVDVFGLEKFNFLFGRIPSSRVT